MLLTPKRRNDIKGLVIISFIFVLFVALFLGANKIMAGSEENKKDPKDVYLGLRNQALGMTLEKLTGVNAIGTHGVYGVLMETGYPEAIVTLAAFLPGDASLYFSTGGGMIGGGGYDSVRKAVVNFNEKADAFIPHCKKSPAFPMPRSGQTIFYILTKEGIYTAQAMEESLGNGKEALSPLFFDGQEVITQFRVAADNKKN